MSTKKKQEWISFIEDGVRWMICKVCQSEYVNVDAGTAAITCSSCTMKKALALKPPIKKRKKLTADEKLFKKIKDYKKRQKLKKGKK